MSRSEIKTSNAIYEIVEIHELLAVFSQGDAAIKMLSVPVGNNRCLDHVVNQLAHTESYRPLKEIKNVYRHRILNPRTRIWIYRPVEDVVRGVGEGKSSTKKTPVSLSPADGKMNYFIPKHGSRIGLIFNVLKCNLKDEKYMFIKNINSADSPWLKRKGITEEQQEKNCPIGVTYEEIKIYNQTKRDAGEIPDWNELIIGLNRNALIGIDVPDNNILARLRGIYVQQVILQKLAKRVPIVIVTPEEGIRIYHEEWQHSDLEQSVLWTNSDELIKMYQAILGILPENSRLKERKMFKHENVQAITDYFNLLLQLPKVLTPIILEYSSFYELIRMRNQIDDTTDYSFRHVHESLNKLLPNKKCENWLEISKFFQNDKMTYDSLDHQSRLKEETKIISIQTTRNTDLISKIEGFFKELKSSQHNRQIVREFRIELVQNCIAALSESEEFNDKKLACLLVEQIVKDNNEWLLEIILPVTWHLLHWCVGKFPIFYRIINQITAKVFNFLPNLNSEIIKKIPSAQLQMYYTYRDGDYTYSNKEVEIMYSPLLFMAIQFDVLLWDKAVSNLSFPQEEVVLVLKNIKSLYHSCQKRPIIGYMDGYSFEFVLEDPRITKAYLRLLLCVKTEANKHYKLNKLEKQLIKNQIEEEIKNVNKLEKVFNLYRKYQNLLCFYQAPVFYSKRYTDEKISFIESLQNKAYGLMVIIKDEKGDINNLVNQLVTDPLFASAHFAQGVSKEWYQEIENLKTVSTFEISFTKIKKCPD